MEASNLFSTAPWLGVHGDGDATGFAVGEQVSGSMSQGVNRAWVVAHVAMSGVEFRPSQGGFEIGDGFGNWGVKLIRRTGMAWGRSAGQNQRGICGVVKSVLGRWLQATPGDEVRRRQIKLPGAVGQRGECQWWSCTFRRSLVVSALPVGRRVRLGG